MERRNVDEKLSAPADFVASDLRNKQELDAAHNLIPPSHFTSCLQPSKTVTMPGPAIGRGSPMTWRMPMQASSSGIDDANQRQAIIQAKQEILELRKTNQRLMELYGNSPRMWTFGTHQEVTSKMSSADKSDPPCRIDTEWKLETERMRAEMENLTGQVDALKEAIGRQRDDIQKRDHSLNRKSEEVEELRAELCQTKTALGSTRAELGQCRAEQEQLSAELEKLKKMEVERDRLESQKIETELCQKTFEESCKLEILKLKEELGETQRKHQTELQQLYIKHLAEVSAIGQTSADLQDRLSNATEEIASLQRRLQQESEQKDKLTEELSQVGKAYETQSTTLQRLRNYVGQLVPERQEEAKQSDMVQKLEKEKEALQVTAELLTIRLNSLVDILAIQEKEMGDKVQSDPLLKDGSKASEVLRCWREKVFVLLVQLRLKDVELRGERVKLLSTISTLEQEGKRLTYQDSMFQHSLQDRIAELDLERVRRETANRELAEALGENERLKGWSQVTGSALKTMSEAVQRFSVMFEDRVTKVQEAQRNLHRLNQRLTFANGRVDTIQGLMMRREALWKVQQASKQPDPASECQQKELALVCEERNNLVQELKRTPDLIEKALSEAQKRFESEVKELKQYLMQSREKALKAEEGHSQAEQKLQEAYRKLEEETKRIEQLQAELVNLQEQSEKALEEKASETEVRFVQQLMEFESQLNTARREHTKAVVTLRQSERQAERDRERLREVHHLQDEQVQKEMQELQKKLQETDKDKNILLAIVHENGFLDQWRKARTTVLDVSRDLDEQHERKPSGKAGRFEFKAKPLTREMMSVLHNLEALSASVVNSSEISSEEDGDGDPTGLSKETVKGPPHHTSEMCRNLEKK